MRALVQISGQSAVDQAWNAQLIGNEIKMSTQEKITHQPNYWVIVKEQEESHFKYTK